MANDKLVSIRLSTEDLDRLQKIADKAGMDRKEAVKRIAADLRAESHPWRSVDLVRSTLVAAGRGGRSGRPRRSES